MKALAILLIVVAVLGPTLVAMAVVGTMGPVSAVWMVIGVAVTFVGSYAAAMLLQAAPTDAQKLYEAAHRRIVELYLQQFERALQLQHMARPPHDRKEPSELTSDQAVVTHVTRQISESYVTASGARRIDPCTFNAEDWAVVPEDLERDDPPPTESQLAARRLSRSDLAGFAVQRPSRSVQSEVQPDDMDPSSCSKNGAPNST